MIKRDGWSSSRTCSRKFSCCAESVRFAARNLELRQQAGYWKAEHARAVGRIGNLGANVEQLRGENRQLKARFFFYFGSGSLSSVRLPR